MPTKAKAFNRTVRRLRMEGFQTRKAKARKRIKYGGPRVDSFIGLRPPAQRIGLLHEATRIPVKCERLIARWRKRAACLSENYTLTMYELRRCAEELERLLK